jgi:fructokinase
MSARHHENSATDREPPVLVIGESLIDIVTAEGRPPIEVVGGSPANVALGLGRLGVSPRLLTALGDDDRGHRIADQLEESGVTIEPESWSLAQTSTASAHIRSHGGADYEFDIEWVLPSPIRLRGAQAIHLGSIAAFLAPGADTLLSFVEQITGRALITFDPNIRPALVGSHASAMNRVMRLAARADVVKLSDEDAEWLWPSATAEDVADLLLHAGASLVAITLGGAGAIATTVDASVQIPAPKVDVVDTVGAGDTFMAALIRQLVVEPRLARNPTETELTRIIEFAAAAASLTVQRSGADLPTEVEVQQVLRQTPRTLSEA